MLIAMQQKELRKRSSSTSCHDNGFAGRAWLREPDIASGLLLLRARPSTACQLFRTGRIEALDY
jgi:hypothetical protein